jgi:hypothetical protein
VWLDYFIHLFIYVLVVFGGLNSGLHACKAGTLLLEPHLQFILLWIFWGLANYLPRVASNSDPPNLNLPISTSQVASITCMSHQHLADFF